jgi:hypothetical protein
VAVGFGFSLALVLGEVAVRLGGWVAPGFYVSGDGPIELRAPGREGGAFPPNVHGEIRHYDYAVECDVNRYGFRDRDPAAKRIGEKRIGFLGDSFTLGMGVNERERFSSVFDAALRNNQPNTTVWNLASPLCGTACEADMLEAVRGQYDLDQIVLAFYAGNDLQDNEAWYQPGNQPEDIARRLDSSRRWIREHVRLASFLWVNSLRAWATFQPDGIYSRATLTADWPHTEQSLERLRQAVPPRALTILYLPAQAEWDDAAWQQLKAQLHLSDDDRFMVRDAVKEWAAGRGVPFVDVTTQLRSCQSGDKCVFPTDPHWTARGHKLVAEGFIDYWQKLNH